MENPHNHFQESIMKNANLSRTHCIIISELVDVFDELLDAPEYVNEYGKWVNTELVPKSPVAGLFLDTAMRTPTLLTCCVNFGNRRYAVKFDLIPELIGTGTIKTIGTFRKDKQGNPQIDIVNSRPLNFAW